MKLITLLVTSLAAVGLASPVAVPEADDISPRDDGHGLFARGSPQVCRVVNASVVNCRLGAGTNYRVVATVKKGDLFVFECVVKGQCVTVGGSTNCGWHRAIGRDFSPHGYCYINGHYTDNKCTVARLGYCGLA